MTRPEDRVECCAFTAAWASAQRELFGGLVLAGLEGAVAATLALVFSEWSAMGGPVIYYVGRAG